ncbi:MAG: hypothetical protein IKY70_02450 [Bacteroidales bacterium]|nr:hypothetical protein [Bacteroidales bacterium]
MYLFNPEHDLCLANGDIHFVPPQSALDFGNDCASLTRFMKGLDSVADCDEPLERIVPWGWNSVLKERLLKEGYNPLLLPSNEQIASITGLSHRRVALEALEYINSRTGSNGSDNKLSRQYFLEAGYRIAAKSIDEVAGFLEKNMNVVLKAPLSGSGKGIRFVAKALSHSDEGWCRNLIKKNGYVVVERRLKPVMEFAMLFKCSGRDRNPVEFIGYSLFYTENGMYKGNILASDEWIENKILKFVPQQTLSLAKESLTDFICQNISGKYDGFIGIDQFAYLPFEDNRIEENYCYNPVVEINMRMTMGLLAHNIYKISCKERELTDGSHYFEIIRSHKDGRMTYSYEIAPIKR